MWPSLVPICPKLSWKPWCSVCCRFLVLHESPMTSPPSHLQRPSGSSKFFLVTKWTPPIQDHSTSSIASLPFSLLLSAPLCSADVLEVDGTLSEEGSEGPVGVEEAVVVGCFLAAAFLACSLFWWCLLSISNLVCLCGITSCVARKIWAWRIKEHKSR